MNTRPTCDKHDERVADLANEVTVAVIKAREALK